MRDPRWSLAALTAGQRQTLALGVALAVLAVVTGYPVLQSPVAADPGTSNGPVAAPEEPEPTEAPTPQPPPVAAPNLPDLLGGGLSGAGPYPGSAPGPDSPPAAPPAPAPPPAPDFDTSPIPGAVPVPSELEPLTLAIGDLLVGGCAAHNSNVTAAIIVLSAGNIDGSLFEVLYVPSDGCFLLGASGTRTTCAIDSSLDAPAVPLDLSGIPIAGPPPVVGALVAIAGAVEQVTDELGVTNGQLASAIADALGCETIS